VYEALALTAVAVSALLLHLRRQRAVRKLEAKLRDEWGSAKSRDRDISLIATYSRALTDRDTPGGKTHAALDDRTWSDLDLDRVFAFVDRTESVVGRELLYHRLRSTRGSLASLASLDDWVELFGRDESLRLAAQRVLRSLDTTSCHWLWSLAVEPINTLPRWAAIYPAFAALMAIGLLLIPFVPPLVLVPVVGFVAGGALRAKLGPRLVPLVDSFRDVALLLASAQRLGSLERLPSGLREELKKRLHALRRVRRTAGWLGRSQAGSEDLVGILLEYLNMLFCLDANALMLSIRELRSHQDDLHEVFRTVGSLDVAISVASVRAGSRQWARPAFTDSSAPLDFANVCHPLLETPVPNSYMLGDPDGLLVTGANMTGKSTFLRTVGVNAVLAQALNIVFASSWRSPWLSIASCLTPSDDLLAGKSYYQAEVETIVAMLNATGAPPGDQAASPRVPVRLYLFDELFRGTNTRDRIGAASAVLRHLVSRSQQPPPVARQEPAGTEQAAGTASVCLPAPAAPAPRTLVIAATHDLEVVSLLATDYAVCHFADRLTESGLQFDYILRPGPTTTRNAIALLGILGAPREVVEEALARTAASGSAGYEGS
jgi:hypothetical protein